MPLNLTLPTNDQISDLPVWARTGFALQCAMRVFPIYEKWWDDAEGFKALSILSDVDDMRFGGDVPLDIPFIAEEAESRAKAKYHSSSTLTWASKAVYGTNMALDSHSKFLRLDMEPPSELEDVTERFKEQQLSDRFKNSCLRDSRHWSKEVTNCVMNCMLAAKAAYSADAELVPGGKAEAGTNEFIRLLNGDISRLQTLSIEKKWKKLESISLNDLGVSIIKPE